MAKAKKQATKAPSLQEPPKIYEGIRGNAGAVKKGAEITQTDAETRRRNGEDVIVCGPDRVTNRRLAGQIERNAIGREPKCCFPHLSAGRMSLPHWQPDPRPPEGHTFYETDKLKAT
ncbi:hypothetical protein [Gemmata sp. SH-PL17]|uniref:hypothetical protein n=1 Tax=Gemmata sp. SH-PL17 TaxID=1630693 RepID=UPI0006976270|nr:hypothetical protein [Gemmata sp. SH-PL17]